ncbi:MULTISPECIES: NAD(P)/FAD-dependent oxidoreductase [Brevibacterium]|uniref:FAD-binding oxidoreductase n=1 Tax=Brevibacterium salitolerans TaxID=1403566 RepID=A0ABN2WD41_9MICO|nr:FAD-binding oxidoreductase [Brevibacterium sp.]
MEFPDRADVVVVGGGIAGVCTAHRLAEAGRSVVLVERGELASGSTSRAAGGLRTQFSDETNILLGARSLEAFARITAQTGQEIDLVRSGYLFLLSTEEDAARFERDVALQNSLGQDSRMLTPAQAQALNPHISTEGLVAAAFNPHDGHCTPESAVAAFAAAARNARARILTHTEATGVRMSGGEVEAVETSRGTVRTPAVVCAAGVWSPEFARTAGVQLPITPLRRQIVVTEPVGFDVRSLPFTIDFSTSFYFHAEGTGLLMGAPEAEDRRTFDQRRDPGWLEHLGTFLEHRAPALADVQVRSGWAGLYECTPDHNALIGAAAEAQGFYYAAGFSGHGFLQGPAVGEVMRDLVLGTEPFVDVRGLSADRFHGAEADLRRELTIV